jgi:steroid delta-isomerase-like uncharacterized protein
MKRRLDIQVLWLTVLLSGCATTGPMAVEHNKAVVQRYFDGWANHADTRVADELIAPDLILRNPPTITHGLDDYKQGMTSFHAAFPDLHFTVEDQIAEKDRVVVRWSLRGTHLGELQGQPATGKSIIVTGTSTFRIADGKIREIWVNMDRLAMMTQLGWLPAPTQPPQALPVSPGD